MSKEFKSLIKYITKHHGYVKEDYTGNEVSGKLDTEPIYCTHNFIVKCLFIENFKIFHIYNIYYGTTIIHYPKLLNMKGDEIMCNYNKQNGTIVVQTYRKNGSTRDTNKFKSDTICTIEDENWLKVKSYINIYKKFIEEKGIYLNLNFIFHGEPGTGKTRFIRSVAKEIGYSIISITLTHLEDNLEFTKKSIYVIEEVDKSLDANGVLKEDIDSPFLLQFLDGNTRPQDSLVIMTTNNIDLLKRSKVLMREGRYQFILKFEGITKTHCDKLVELYFNITDSLELWNAIKKKQGINISRLDNFLQNCIFNSCDYDTTCKLAKDLTYESESSNYMYL